MTKSQKKMDILGHNFWTRALWDMCGSDIESVSLNDSNGMLRDMIARNSLSCQIDRLTMGLPCYVTWSKIIFFAKIRPES